jgi:hypothetical protein
VFAGVRELIAAIAARSVRARSRRKLEDVMDGDDEAHDAEFAALIGEVDSYETMVSAAVGAARDLAQDLDAILAELEDVLCELSPQPARRAGEEPGPVRLEIEIAQVAISKLAQITNALDAVEARRGL